MSFIKLDPTTRKAVLALKTLGPKSKRALRRSLFEFSKDLIKTARKSIIDPPKSGRVYLVRLRGRAVRHQASAPGQPPANLSGALKDTITTRLHGVSQLRFEAGSASVPYAAPLELGNKKGTLKPRPYLIAAIEKNDKNFEERIGSFIVKAINRASR